MKHTQHIAYFKVPYKQKDNDNYQNNDNFCCGDKKSSKGDGITDNEDPELNQFYYHSDHLGSSSYITNLNGSIVQHVEYVPFGEVFIEERNNKWNTPYLFNGKELDEETGLYYYGARYYNSRNSLWLSVDPLAEKYLGVSPYCYTMNNPVKFIDPDGREVDWVESINGDIYWDENATSQETTKAGETYLGKNVLVGTHNRDDNLNEPINSAKFDLYLESDKTGLSATIYGNTVPADPTMFGTLAEGLYSAKFGHRNKEKYKNELALRIYNLDGYDGLSTVKGNPSKTNSDLLTGVLFHMGNNYQKSLYDSRGNAYSQGCQTGGNYPGSHIDHNAFMKVAGKDFNGNYYLRAKSVIKSVKYFNKSFTMPIFTTPVDNTYVAPLYRF